MDSKTTTEPTKNDSAQTSFNPAALQDPKTRRVLDEVVRQAQRR